MELNKRFFHRLRTILASAVSRIVLLFGNLIVSFILIRTESAELWGEVVSYILLIDLGFSIVNWGHSPYLVREFSLRPASMEKALWSSIASRFLLLLIFVGIIWICPLNFSTKLLLTLWILARFVYQAFDPELQYSRRYLAPVVMEMSGLAIILVPVVGSWVPATVQNILSLFAWAFVLRATAMLIFQRKLVARLLRERARPTISEFLVPAFPFLMLTLSAMLHQRADLYVVAWFLEADDVAGYQVFVNLLFTGQLAASLILSPFSKNIFRLPPASLRKLETTFMRSGVVLTVFFCLALYCVVKYVYRFELPWTLYLMAYLYVSLSFMYLLRNYQLGKLRRQKTVAFYSFAGFGVNLALSLILTPNFGLQGAMLSGLLAQIFTTTLYLNTPIASPSYVSR